MFRNKIATNMRAMAARHSTIFTRASIRNSRRIATSITSYIRTVSPQSQLLRPIQARSFHATSSCQAQGPSADALMESLTDLYSTAKDEFEIAAEETEKKTVYAAEDREAAKEALQNLKEAYERAVKESDPDVAKEVQSRTGPRIRELENAVIAMEEMAMED